MKKRIIFTLLSLCIFLSGCNLTKRGLLDDNTYYSTNSPNILIKLNPEFTYSEDESSRTLKVFGNENDGRFVYIKHYPWVGPKNMVDYWTPSVVFQDTPNKIDTGTLTLLNRKWYYCNSFVEFSSAQCGLFRKLGMFTQNHEWLIVVYLQLLPPFDCDKWKNIKALTDEQRDFLDEFIAEFSKTIEMDNYHPDEKGAK